LDNQIKSKSIQWLALNLSAYLVICS